MHLIVPSFAFISDCKTQNSPKNLKTHAELCHWSVAIEPKSHVSPVGESLRWTGQTRWPDPHPGTAKDERGEQEAALSEEGHGGAARRRALHYAVITLLAHSSASLQEETTENQTVGIKNRSLFVLPHTFSLSQLIKEITAVWVH